MMPTSVETKQQYLKRMEVLYGLDDPPGALHNPKQQAVIWTPDPTKYAELKQRASMSGAGLSQDELSAPDVDTFLYRYLPRAMKTIKPDWKWKPQYQKYGTCVGQADKLAYDVVWAIYCVIVGVPYPGRFSVAGMYTGGRVEIARQPGAWEGSNCVWCGDFNTKHGGILLTALGLDNDDKDADENLAMKWTRTRDGIPANFEAMATQHMAADILVPDSAREIGKGIQAGVVYIHGSQIIPTGGVDSRGFSPGRQSRGGHATTFTAVRHNPFGLLYQNSWNGWGQVVYPSDQPEGSVWITEQDANRIIAARDTLGIRAKALRQG